MEMMLMKIIGGALMCMISVMIYVKNIQSEINK